MYARERETFFLFFLHDGSESSCTMMVRLLCDFLCVFFFPGFSLPNLHTHIQPHIFIISIIYSILIPSAFLHPQTTSIHRTCTPHLLRKKSRKIQNLLLCYEIASAYVDVLVKGFFLQPLFMPCAIYMYIHTGSCYFALSLLHTHSFSPLAQIHTNLDFIYIIAYAGKLMRELHINRESGVLFHIDAIR